MKSLSLARVILTGYSSVANRRLLSFMSASPQKKLRTQAMKIATHDGQFHCDEALACFLLRQLDQYKDAEIIRTRDPARIDSCDIVVDVGGTFDPEKNRFDHHQRTFSHSLNSLVPSKKWVTKLSSAGLVYCFFGKKIVASILDTSEDDEVTDVIFDKVYENFVEEIDAIDNGIHQHDGEPRYRMSTGISSRVGYLNPRWNEPDADETACFLKAMKMVGEEFKDRVLYYKTAWLPARELVEEAVKKRLEIDPSGEIVTFVGENCPWKDHLFNLEEKLKIDPLIKYVLYSDNKGKWRVHCVPIRLGSFETRLGLPEEWRGFRDEELSKISGIPGCIFAHASGFMGGNHTYEGALQMARASLKQKQKNST